MAPLKRKSVEPMVVHLAPSTTRSRHQSLHHFVADSAWSDEQMLLRVAQWVVPAMDRRAIAVGTPIAERPPHRSQRAQFTHWAPTLGV
jgi:SRSO17 transposase